MKFGVLLGALALIGCTTIPTDGPGYAGAPEAMRRFIAAARQCGVRTSRPVRLRRNGPEFMVEVYIRASGRGEVRRSQERCVDEWVEQTGGDVQAMIVTA